MWAAAEHAATLLRAWYERFESGSLVLERSEERTAGLADGDVDAALVWAPPEAPDRIRGLATLPIGLEPRMAAVAADDPRAAAQALRMSDLAHASLVLNPQAGTTTLELWPPGDRPHVAATVKNADDWLVAIAAGVGIGVTVAATSRLHPHPDVRYVRWLMQRLLRCCWRGRTARPIPAPWPSQRSPAMRCPVPPDCLAHPDVTRGPPRRKPTESVACDNHS